MGKRQPAPWVSATGPLGPTGRGDPASGAAARSTGHRGATAPPTGRTAKDSAGRVSGQTSLLCMDATFKFVWDIVVKFLFHWSKNTTLYVLCKLLPVHCFPHFSHNNYIKSVILGNREQ